MSVYLVCGGYSLLSQILQYLVEQQALGDIIGMEVCFQLGNSLSFQLGNKRFYKIKIYFAIFNW